MRSLRALSVHGLQALPSGSCFSRMVPFIKVIDDSVQTDKRSSSFPSSTKPPNRASKRHPSSTRMDLPSEHLLPRSLPCEKIQDLPLWASQITHRATAFLHTWLKERHMALRRYSESAISASPRLGLPRAVQIAGASISVFTCLISIMN